MFDVDVSDFVCINRIPVVVGERFQRIGNFPGTDGCRAVE